ncbi:MAG TPA: phage tail tube protein [Nitrospira sp.]|nr:phage tail tube protein [Nitrospira sp.]
MVIINSAEANRAQLRYIKEAVWGVTPANGNTAEARITDSSLTRTKNTQTSKEIRADRMVPSIAEVGSSAGGSVDFEFSAGSLDAFLEGFLLGAWTRSMNFFQVKGNTVSVTATDTVKILGVDYTNYITANQYLKLEGFTDPANNKYIKVTSVAFTAGATVITATGAALVAEAGTAFTKVLDANDVILRATDIEIAAGNEITTTAGSFAGLKVGQTIYFEGLGKGEGSVLWNAADPVAGDTITVSDGTNTVVFEINTSPDAVGEGNVYVALSDTEATMGQNFTDAVNAQWAKGVLKVTSEFATATSTLTNHAGAGGSIVASDVTTATVTNFAGGDNAKFGFLTVLALPDSKTIQVAETLTVDTNASALPAIVKGSHLRNPGVVSEITKQSFTVETSFTDVSKNFVARGQRPGSFSLDVKTGDIVTGSIDFMGRDIVHSSTALLSNSPYVPLDSTATEILNATSNVGSIKYQGTPLDLAIQNITMKGDNNLREQRAVGEQFPAGIGYGKFDLSGTADAYFESFELYQAFVDHTTVSLSFDFTDVDNNHYIFTVPAVKFTKDPISPDGVDTDVMEKMEWTAQRDPVLKTQLMVDRYSSIWPMAA